jgi:hypothetical protein
MRKISTVVTNRNEILKDHKLTIGLDLGDRFSHYCILDEGGEVLRENRVPTTPKGIEEVFGKIPPSRIALENRDPFTLGQPAVDPLGARSDRGTCTQCASDRGQ